MICRINDFKYKDVISSSDGVRLGFVGDVELDTQNAALTAIVIRGRYRLFGLLGREEDTVIPWEDIEVIGEDTILVTKFPTFSLSSLMPIASSLSYSSLA